MVGNLVFAANPQEPLDDTKWLLVINERTKRTHVSNILNKLHLANRTQASLYALRERLADLEPLERAINGSIHILSESSTH